MSILALCYDTYYLIDEIKCNFTSLAMKSTLKVKIKNLRKLKTRIICKTRSLRLMDSTKILLV